MEEAKKEFEEIAKFGNKSRNPPVRNNIARATEMGLEIVRKYNLLVRFFILFIFPIASLLIPPFFFVLETRTRTICRK